MGINTTILEGIRHYTDEYRLNPSEVEDFLTSPRDFSTRQDNAIEIIEGIMTAHGKRELSEYIVQLAKVEYDIRELELKGRDHVVHALLSFLLGVFINEHLLKPRGRQVDPFQWKLAGLFHDVGYPAQIAKDSMLKPYVDQINSIKRELSVKRPDLSFRLFPVGLNELSNRANSFRLIQNRLERWGLVIDAKEEYNRMVDSGNICHGMISSLSILYVVDMMYQKNNPEREYVDNNKSPSVDWKQPNFEKDVVSACAAIFVHHLPKRCFQSAPLDRIKAALPFLLRLSDCLQDWDRPSADNPSGFPDNDYDIDATSGRLVFKVAKPDRRDKIAQEIASILVAPDIEVVGI